MFVWQESTDLGILTEKGEEILVDRGTFCWRGIVT